MNDFETRLIREHSSGSPPGPAILQVVPQFNAGGAERSAVDISAALAREGFAPLVASRGGRMIAELQAKGGEWIPMSVHSKTPLALAINTVRLRRLIRARNIKLIHARSRAPAWSALHAARRTGIPFVTTWHGAYSADSPLKRIYNSVMLRGDAVIANSNWTAESILNDYAFQPKRLAVIRRGMDLEAFDPGAVSEERIRRLRAQWGAKPEEIVVLLPGRITRRKGQLVLIEAMAQLAGGGARVRAVFAGEAHGHDSYSRQIDRVIAARGLKNAVITAGHVEDMPAAYLAADLALCTSIEPEAFGRVATEAGAMGRPVIATDHGGARETVLPGVSGLLVPPGDGGALARAVTDMTMMGPEARAAMGARGRGHVRENFTLERMAAETLSLYRELLAT